MVVLAWFHECLHDISCNQYIPALDLLTSSIIGKCRDIDCEVRFHLTLIPPDVYHHDVGVISASIGIIEVDSTKDNLVAALSKQDSTNKDPAGPALAHLNLLNHASCQSQSRPSQGPE